MSLQLAESAGECRLAALVRTADDNDSFAPLEVKIIADRCLRVGKQLAGKSQVKPARAADVLAGTGHERIAQGQACSLEPAHEIHVGEIELDLLVESRHRTVGKLPVLVHVGVQRRKDLRVQFSTRSRMAAST